MAFGQVQGREGAPPSPGTDTFKGSRATRDIHRGGEGVPPTWVGWPSRLASLGPPAPAPRASRSASYFLCSEDGGHKWEESRGGGGLSSVPV